MVYSGIMAGDPMRENGGTEDAMQKRGETYELALGLRPCLLSDLPPNSRTALVHALESIDRAMQGEANNAAPVATCEELAAIYDMDAIDSFSDAWAIWRDAASMLRDARRRAPLDQEFFTGKHPSAASYFRGIGELARSNADAIGRWMQKLGVRGAEFLDLGAGTGEHAATFLQLGVAARAVCVDYPYVVNTVAKSVPGQTWVGADLRQGTAYAKPHSVDALWISNVLHHYSMKDCGRILRACRSFLSDNVRVLVHEYLVGASGKQGVAAGMLGLHFALTTDGGRCYSRNEIRELLAESLGVDEVHAELGLANSTVLMLR